MTWKGGHHTEESKRKKSFANWVTNGISRKHTAEARRNMSLAQTGKRLSEERKRKIGQFHNGKKWYLSRRNTAEARAWKDEYENLGRINANKFADMAKANLSGNGLMKGK